MRKVLLPVDDDPTITVTFSFSAGSQNDPPGREGLAALTAAMLTEAATERLRYEEILERLYPLATDYDATVDKELTTIGGRVHRDKASEYIALLLDALLRPAFDTDDFERLQHDAINYIGNTLRYASDEELGKAALTAAAFAGTRYAHPVEGTISGLEAITPEDVRAFYRSHYTRQNLTLGLAGCFDASHQRELEAACTSLPEGAAPAAPSIEPAPLSGRRVVLIDKPGADASISFGKSIDVVRGERDFYALWLANSWLGEHRHGASHLFQVIRETRGLNYGDYSYIEAFPDAGALQMPPVNVPRRRQLFEVWIRTLPNEQAAFAIRTAIREIDKLVAHGMTADQFELTRKFLIRYSTHYAPTTETRLGYAVDDRFYGIGKPGHLDRLQKTLADLSLEEVNAAIRKFWRTDSLVIAIVTGDAAGMAAALTGKEPTPIAYASEMPADVLSEDELIAAYPLKIDSTRIERLPVDSVFA
jgi:zinc protease